MLTRMQKSRAVRFHNGGMPFKEICVTVEADPDDLESFFKTRPGYPDLIYSPRSRYVLKGRSPEERQANKRSPARRPTQPRRASYIPTSKLGGTPSLAPTPVLDRLNEKYGFLNKDAPL